MKTNVTDIIEQIEKESQAIGFDQVSDRKVGALLSTLCASKPGGRFLEFGTGSGLSTAWMIAGMDSASELMTVENDRRVLDIAEKYLSDIGNVTFVYGEGEKTIASIEKGSIDILFADTWPGKYTDLDEALALLKIGGVYVIDDMLPQENWPEGHAEKAEALIDYLRKRDDLIVSYLDWASGVYICTKTERNEKETNSWNADNYQQHASFVSALALPVVDLLNPQEGERILDLGCGEGTLGLEIARYGASVLGVDLSAEMVAKARENGLEAEVMSVTQMPFDEAFDAVFSNAMLHWVREPELAVAHIAKALKSGGRFVAEFGGAGNVHHIVEAMRAVFWSHLEYGVFDDLWYFPTPEQYSKILEAHGLEITSIELIPRPTPIDDIAHWLALFTNGVTEHLSPKQTAQFRVEVRERLKESSYTEAEGWVADYVRLRVKAIKQ